MSFTTQVIEVIKNLPGFNQQIQVFDTTTGSPDSPQIILRGGVGNPQARNYAGTTTNQGYSWDALCVSNTPASARLIAQTLINQQTVPILPVHNSVALLSAKHSKTGPTRPNTAGM